MIIKKADSLMNDSEIDQLVNKVDIWSLVGASMTELTKVISIFNDSGMVGLLQNGWIKSIPKEDLEYWTIEADEYNFIINNSVEHLIVPLDTLATYSLSDSLLVHTINLPNFDKFNLNGSLSKEITGELSKEILRPTGDRYNILSLLKNSSSYQKTSPNVDKILSDVENVISKIIDPNQFVINKNYLNRSNIGMVYLSGNSVGNITPTLIVETRPNLAWINENNTSTNLKGNYSFLYKYFEPSAVTYLLAKIRKILYRKGQPKDIREKKNIKTVERSIRNHYMSEMEETMPKMNIINYTDFKTVSLSYLTKGLLLLPIPYAITIWENYKDALEASILSERLGGDIDIKTERLIIKKLKRNFKNFMQDNSYTRPLSIKRIKEQYTSRVVSNIIREAVQTSLPGFKQGDGRQQGFNLEKSDGGLPSNIENLQEVLKSPLERLELEGKMAFLKTGELEINKQGLQEFTKKLSVSELAAMIPGINIASTNSKINSIIDKMIRSSDYLTTLLDGISSERLSNLTLKGLLEILYDNEPDFKNLLDTIVNRHGANFFERILNNSPDGFFLGKYIEELIDIDGQKSPYNLLNFDHSRTDLNNIKPNQGHTVVINIRTSKDSTLNDRSVVLGFKFNEDIGKEGLVIEEVVARIIRQRGPQASFTIDMNASSDYYIEVRKVIKRIFSPELFYSPAGKTSSGQVGGKINPMHRSAQLLSSSIKNMLSSNPNIIEVEPFKYDALTNAVRGIYIFFNPHGTITKDYLNQGITLHSWVTVDSRKAGPVRSGYSASGSMCMGSFMLSTTTDSFNMANSNCINALPPEGENTEFPVLEGGGSSATLDLLASLMTGLGYLNSDPSTGVSSVERQLVNQLESVYVPSLPQSSNNVFPYNLKIRNENSLTQGFGFKSLFDEDTTPTDIFNEAIKSMSTVIRGNISLLDDNKFEYRLILKGESVGKIVDFLGLHSFTLGQSIETAEELVLRRTYSYKVNREALMKFMNLQNDPAVREKLRLLQNSFSPEDFYNNPNDDIEKAFKNMPTVDGLITNITEVLNEDYILYNNEVDDRAYKKKLFITDLLPDEKDTEIIMLKQLILFINIKDEKTLTLENFKEFINKNKSDIINKIITETTLGTDYSGRGNRPEAVINSIRARKLM